MVRNEYMYQVIYSSLADIVGCNIYDYFYTV